MKRVIIILLFCLLSPGVFAQGGSTNRYEVGLGCAPFIGRYMSSDGGPNVKYYMRSFFEWRRETGRLVDYGAKISYMLGPYTQYLPTGRQKGMNHNYQILAVADVSIIPNCYLGLSIGPSLDLISSQSSKTIESFFGFGAGPRIGIEIQKHFRISADTFFTIGDSVYFMQPICLNLGWTF